MRIGIVTSHVIQYQTPFFKELAKSADVHVFFCWTFGARPTFDDQFGKEIMWDIPLLEGFDYTFLRNHSFRPSSKFWGQINPSIIRELWGKKYDVLILYGWNSFTNILAYATCLLRGTSIFLHGESTLLHELTLARWRRVLKKIILKIFFFPIRRFLCIGSANRAFYRYCGVSIRRLVYTPYSVDTKRLFVAADLLRTQRDVIRGDLCIPRDAVVFLFVGKFVEKKRPHDIIQALQKTKSPNSFAFFVGDGKLSTSLRASVPESIKNRVHFAGFQGQRELAKYYILADSLILPSGIGETWGLVVNEAMCFGLPIVVSDYVGCAPDLVKNHVNGFVIPCGNVLMLANSIDYLTENADDRLRFGMQSRRIIQDYTYARGVEAVIATSRY